jgi:outer membrane lipoprotein-sorting protein
MRRSYPIRALVVFAFVLPLAGCLFHSRRVEHQLSNTPLQSATQQELIDWIDDQASKLQTLQATVDIDTSVGGEKTGKITDYKEIRGYILLRKPAMLRMIGLMPIVRNKAFDMVSDGNTFKIWIPPKNRFAIGKNDVDTSRAKSALESIRPQDIYNALLIHAIDSDKEIAVLENGRETVLDSHKHRVELPDYEIVVIRKGRRGWYLSRRVIFSRTDLRPHRQFIYGEDGSVRTEVHYERYENHSGIWFPGLIEILRPVEEYDITLSIVKLEINKHLSDSQFELAVPPGAEVVHLDQPPIASHNRASSGGDGDPHP